ncbi:MAG: PAS domain-containing protein [Actinobacteria bacterium]|nr:PAS domain-containing protein [Actinomycetota bacterium]
MTPLLELRLPATSVPTRDRVARHHVKIRFGLFLAAWALLAAKWFDPELFVFEVALALAVLVHAARRERLLASVDRKRVQLELVTAVAGATENAADVDELLARAAEEICGQSCWPCGRVWLPNEDGTLKLTYTQPRSDEGGAWPLAATNEEGLARRVLATGRACDESKPDDGAGATFAFAFPIVADREVAAILEFCSSEQQPKDDALLATHEHLSRQLGEVIKRARAERQMHSTDERLRSLIQTLPLATYIDRPGEQAGTIWVSPQMAEITSYTPEDWAADPALFRKVLHPDDHDRVLGELKRIKQTGEPLDHEYRMIRRDGGTVWVHDLAVTVEHDGTDVTRGFIVDVTARRVAEQERDETLVQLRGQNEKLRQVDSLKDEFIALVSHELRTPLTSIRGYLELVRDETNLTEEQARFLDTIDRNAVRLQGVVGDLLFFAQVEAGKLTLERGDVDVNALLTDAADTARPTATARSIRLSAELGPELPTIRGDCARLAQVVDNFVSNAIKFTPGSGDVIISSVAHVEELEIAVRDTGMGISAAELPRLFQRFFRTERATAQAIAGTGLGLAIAKAIVEGHKGRITVESVEGAGTTFRIFLPR